MSLLKQIQNRFASLFGFEGAKPAAFVKEHLQGAFGEALHYWVQILIAMGIATLGLVINSTASVIGAMLISPLMGPIERIGIGLASGSFLLTIRASIRIVTSIIVIVLASALLVYLLPFHEVTKEVLSRTQPTALDLGVAILCGMIGSYTTAVKSGGVSSTAAGTAIAIALVPPLCVVGFGVGTFDMAIAQGSMLLFLTNLAAIVLVTTFFFAALGIAEVPVTDLEKQVLDDLPSPTKTSKIFLKLRSMVGSRVPPFVRMALPILVLFTLMVPLIIGLRKVSHSVRTRNAIGQLLQEKLKDQTVLQQEIVIAEDSAAVILSLVGEPGSLHDLEVNLATELPLQAEMQVELILREVPDAAAIADKLSQLERRQALLALSPSSAPSSLPTPPKPKSIAEIETRLFREVNDALQTAWPENTLPLPLRLEVVLDKEDALTVNLVTYGEKGLSSDGKEAMERSLSRSLAVSTQLTLHHIPTIIFEGNDSTLLKDWVTLSYRTLEACREQSIHVVIRGPFLEEGQKRVPRDREAANRLVTDLAKVIEPTCIVKKTTEDEVWHIFAERIETSPEAPH